MSELGCWVTPDNGAHYFNMAQGGARVMSFVQRLTIDASIKVQTFTVPATVGYTLFAVPVVTGGVYEDPMSLIPLAQAIQSITFSGNVVTVTLINDLTRFTTIPVDNVFEVLIVDIFQASPRGEQQGNSGLYLPDSTYFGGITDVTKAGLCVYRATITVNGTWTVPAGVQGRENCTVFANWSSSSVTVEYDSRNKTITTTGGSVTLKIAIFANGFTLTIPDRGLYIYNASGVCVFNSIYMPFFLVSTINPSSGWKDTGIARPMLPLGVAGAGGAVSNKYMQMYNTGYRMNGSSVATARGKNIAYFFTDGWAAGFADANVAMPVLNADHYFS